MPGTSAGTFRPIHIGVCISIHSHGKFLFTFGAWFALGGSATGMPFIRSRAALVLGAAYLLFALVITNGGPVDELRSLIPPEIYSAFNPNDKTNLDLIACYTLSVFLSLSFVAATRLAGVGMAYLSAAIKCRLAVARSLLRRHIPILRCTFRVVEISGAIWMQIVSALSVS